MLVSSKSTPARMRAPHHLFNRHDGAERIRHVGQRHHLHARAEQLLELLDEEVAVLVDRRPDELRAATLAVEMPGHDVGTVSYTHLTLPTKRIV